MPASLPPTTLFVHPPVRPCANYAAAAAVGDDDDDRHLSFLQRCCAAVLLAHIDEPAGTLYCQHGQLVVPGLMLTCCMNTCAQAEVSACNASTRKHSIHPHSPRLQSHSLACPYAKLMLPTGIEGVHATDLLASLAHSKTDNLIRNIFFIIRAFSCKVPEFLANFPINGHNPHWPARIRHTSG